MWVFEPKFICACPEVHTNRSIREAGSTLREPAPLPASLRGLLLPPPLFRVGLTPHYKPRIALRRRQPGFIVRSKPHPGQHYEDPERQVDPHTRAAYPTVTQMVNSRINSPLQCAPSGLKHMRSKGLRSHRMGFTLQRHLYNLISNINA